MVSDAPNKYKGQRPHRKKRPVVQIGPTGELSTRLERKLHENDFHFDKPVDEYFADHKVNKLIHDTRRE